MRKVRTGSGATAVQIAEYLEGRKRILAHVGSAHTPVELGVLLERARAMLENPAQGVLDIDAEPRATIEGLVDEPAAEQPLFPDPASANPSRRDSAGQVVEPTSLLDTGRVLTDVGQDSASYATMKRTLTRVLASDYRAVIAERCFAHASAESDISLILYDVTALYFEAEKEDGLRKVGYSKERRVDPRIVVGLLVDRRGFPLEIGCFEPNLAATTTLIPIVREFQARHGIADMVVVADAGMLSAANLTTLDDASLRFIVGSRIPDPG